MKSLYVGICTVLAAGFSYISMIAPTLESDFKPQSKMFEQEIPFDQDVYETFIKDESPIILRFTADWCIYCKYQEPAWLSDTVQNIGKDNRVLRMVVDLTEKDQTSLQLLRKFKRNSIPTYVFIKGDQHDIFNGWATKNGFKNWILDNLEKE